MNESSSHYGQLKKLASEDYMLHGSIYIIFWKKTQNDMAENRWVVAKHRVVGREWLQRGNTEIGVIQFYPDYGLTTVSTYVLKLIELNGKNQLYSMVILIN